MHLPPTHRAPRLSRSGLILSLYTGLALVAFGVGALRGHIDIFHFSGNLPGASSPATTIRGIFAGAAFAIVVVFLSRYAFHRLEWARLLRVEFRHILGSLSTGEVVVLAAASSVGEELFFRGALVPATGLWISSALFALPHIGPGARFLPWTATSLFAGLAFGSMFLHYGDLAAPVTAHFLINLLNLRYIVRR